MTSLFRFDIEADTATAEWPDEITGITSGLKPITVVEREDGSLTVYATKEDE